MQCYLLGVWVGYATYVGKRNVEGGPRQDTIAVDAGRMVMGLRGELGYKDWEYDVSMLYECGGRSATLVDLYETERRSILCASHLMCVPSR